MWYVSLSVSDKNVDNYSIVQVHAFMGCLEAFQPNWRHPQHISLASRLGITVTNTVYRSSIDNEMYFIQTYVNLSSQIWILKCVLHYSFTYHQLFIYFHFCETDLSFRIANHVLDFLICNKE